VLSDEKADGAVFITSDTFTPDAIAFAAGKRLELIDGPTLRTMIAAVKTTAAAEAPAQVSECPRCGSPMVLRTATRGANIGGTFWGCSTYPACKGTRPASDRSP
jgi:restriction system protein